MKRKILIIGLAGLMLLFAGCNKVQNTNIKEKQYKGQTYYIEEEATEYEGDYDLQIKQFKEEAIFSEDDPDYYDFNLSEKFSYTEYEEFCKNWDLEQKYTDESKNYIVFSYLQYYCDGVEVRLCDVTTIDNKINLYVWDSFSSRRLITGSMDGGVHGYAIVIPTDKNYENIQVCPTITSEEFKEIKQKPDDIYYVDKPVIYIYPEEEKEISVTLKDSNRLTCSYPKYIDGWKVIAKPDGTLKYNDKSLYCLYYENIPVKPFTLKEDGFIVKGSDAASFLEEKLSILGLNEKESQEFIIYWLPKLEANEYNYVRFADNNEIIENMDLDISPKPDTTIRILMTFKGLDKPITVKEQVLEKVQRTGYTVIEWGGTEIK